MLLDQEAKKKNVTVTPADIASRIAEARQQIAQQFPGRSLEDLLAQNHRSLAEFKDNIRYRVLAEKLAGGGVTPVPSLHVRHILILTQNPTGAPDAKPHTEAEAQAIIAEDPGRLEIRPEVRGPREAVFRGSRATRTRAATWGSSTPRRSSIRHSWRRRSS